jgi:CBS domain containing-hemolysin-like protein
MILALQITATALLILLGAFFAGSETGTYRLSRFQLRLGMQQGKTAYGILGRILGDGHGMVLSALIGNNLANYAATSIVTYIMLDLTDAAHSAELYTTAIMTPVLFIFVDIIPKSIYYLHANILLPKLAPLTWFFYTLFRYTGLVALLKLISNLLSRLFGLHVDAANVISAGQRTLIKQIINETRDEGIVSAFQKEVMDRTVDIPTMPLRSVMIPFSRTVVVDVDTDTDALRHKLAETAYTRLPVYSGTARNFIGFINICDVLASGRQFQNLEPFVQPIERIPAASSVLDAITHMLTRGSKMMLVVPTQQNADQTKVLGIVTMKDLVEELTGELTPWQD